MKIGFSEQLHRKIIFSGGWVKDSPGMTDRSAYSMDLSAYSRAWIRALSWAWLIPCEKR